MRAGNQLANASAAPVGEVSESHAGSMVCEEGLVNVALVGVAVADESRDAVEALSFILAEVEDKGHQGREDGAVTNFREVCAEAKKNLFS